MRGEVGVISKGVSEGECFVVEAIFHGKEKTEELAVMVDTFRPLRLTKQAADLEDDTYAYSWLPENH